MKIWFFFPKGDTFGNISITSVALWFLKKYFQNKKTLKKNNFNIQKIIKKIFENLFWKYFFKNQKKLKLTKCHLLAQSVTFMTLRWHFFLEKCHPLKKHFNWKFDFCTQKVTLLAIFRSPQPPYDFLNVEKNIFF